MLLKILLQAPPVRQRLWAREAEAAGPSNLASAVMSHTMLDCRAAVERGQQQQIGSRIGSRCVRPLSRVTSQTQQVHVWRVKRGGVIERHTYCLHAVSGQLPPHIRST